MSSLTISTRSVSRLVSVCEKQAEIETMEGKFRMNDDVLAVDKSEPHETGMLAKQNQLYPDAAVEDRVMSVSGVNGDHERMLAEFAEESVVLEVERLSDLGRSSALSSSCSTTTRSPR